MHCLEIIIRLNSETQCTPHNLRMHPRIYALRQGIRGMAVQGEYVSRLYAALYKYANQFIDRPHYKPGEGWDDLEALQQVTLGDWMEESIQAKFANYGGGSVMAEQVNYPTNNPVTELSTRPNSKPYVVLRLVSSTRKPVSPSASPKTDGLSPPDPRERAY